MNTAQEVSIALAPLVPATLSFTASLTIIIMIRRSTVKLSTVYRRLVFGLCVCDVILSLSQMGSSFVMPSGTFWGSIGNDVTCDIQGFMAVIGTCATVMYSLSLSIYFLLVAKFNMSEQRIKKRIEPYLHIFIIVYSLGGGIYIYVTHNYNPAGAVCWINSEPLNCYLNPDVGCTSVGNPYTLKYIFVIGPILAVYCISICILAVILHTVRSQASAAEAYRTAWVSQSIAHGADEAESGSSPHHSDTSIAFRSSLRCIYATLVCKLKKKSLQNENEPNPLNDYLNSRPTTTILQRRQTELSNRAIAYIVGYLLTYGFPAAYRFCEKNSSAPFAIILLSRIFFPCQGLFNILIYTYPHVCSFRRHHEDDSWFRAFWEVVKSGGDGDDTGTSSRRKSSLRQMNLVLQQNQRKAALKNCRNFPVVTRDLSNIEQDATLTVDLQF